MEANGIPGGGSGFCILRLFTIDINGGRKTLLETKINGRNGTLQLLPGLNIDYNKYQYFIEITAGAKNSVNGVNNNYYLPGFAKLVSCSLSYEGFPVN
jgi:hypothetical protein